MIMNANNDDGEIVDLANQLSSSSEAWIGSSPEATRATFRGRAIYSNGFADDKDVACVSCCLLYFFVCLFCVVRAALTMLLEVIRCNCCDNELSQPERI